MMGSAKSTANIMELIEHSLVVSNGRTLLFAQTLKQLAQGVMPFYRKYLPDKYIEKISVTKADIYIKLTNGHEIIGFSSDDEEKFRTLDCTAAYLEEFSGIKREIYEEVLRRLRHPAGVIDGKQYYMVRMASNPSIGFVRDMIFSGSKIYGSSYIKDTVKLYMDRVVDPNPDIEVFLSSSRDNTYLPNGYIQRVERSLTPEKARLYIDCIIEYAEGAVYPDFLTHVVDDFEVPKHWKFILTHDPGINDPSALLLCAINTDGITEQYKKKFYVIKEFKQNNLALAQIVPHIHEMIDGLSQGQLIDKRIDPASNKRDPVYAMTYKSQLAIKYNLHFSDANNRIIDGVQKLKDMFYEGLIGIFRSCVKTIEEGCEYRYPTAEERKGNKNLGDKPIDFNNHLMDCLRYFAQHIPMEFLDNSNTVKYNSSKDIKELFRKSLYDMQREESNNILITGIKAEDTKKPKNLVSNRVFGGYRMGGL